MNRDEARRHRAACNAHRSIAEGGAAEIDPGFVESCTSCSARRAEIMRSVPR